METDLCADRHLLYFLSKRVRLLLTLASDLFMMGCIQNLSRAITKSPPAINIKPPLNGLISPLTYQSCDSPQPRLRRKR